MLKAVFLISQLTTNERAQIWVNLAQVQAMKTVPNVTEGHPSTLITFVNQHTMYVFEGPAEIAILANTPNPAETVS
jgi:hypothetical protein